MDECAVIIEAVSDIIILDTGRIIRYHYLEGMDTRQDTNLAQFILEWDQEKYDVFGQYNGLTGWKAYSVFAEWFSRKGSKAR